jgi:hypothetical protein
LNPRRCCGAPLPSFPWQAAQFALKICWPEFGFAVAVLSAVWARAMGAREKKRQVIAIAIVLSVDQLLRASKPRRFIGIQHNAGPKMSL